MIRRLLSVTFLLALPIASVFAQQKPDFSGTWVLNVANSEFGILGGPNSRIDVISHKGSSLSDDITAVAPQGKQEYKNNYTTDGKQAVNKLGTLEIRSTAKWLGRNLVISSKYVVNNANISSEATWTLSPDGKTLTMTTRFKGSVGDTSQKLVFEKQ
jgi:hypothetical protein